VSYDDVEDYIKENNINLQYIKSTKNLGVSGGRNLGLNYAKGEFVAFMDDDAEFKIDSIQLLYLRSNK
jgi:GT2 family glycosyltransferase